MSGDQGFFTGAAASYHRARSPLPAELARDLAERARAGRGPDARRLLDLGCGTGLVIEALLPRGFDDVIGVDPDEDMLAEAARHLAGRPVRLVPGGAEDAPLPDGWRPDLVTAGRSFHWTDQPVVAGRVHALLPAGGVLALFADSGLWESSTPWKAAFRETVQTFLGAERRAGEAVVRPGGRDWSELLAEAGFRHVEEYDVASREVVPLDDITGYAHSYSFAAPPLFGDRLAEFDEALLDAVAPYAVNGELRDELPWHVHLARR